MSKADLKRYVLSLFLESVMSETVRELARQAERVRRRWIREEERTL